MSSRIFNSLLTVALASVPAFAEVVVRVPTDVVDLGSAILTVPDGGVIELEDGVYSSPYNGFQIDTSSPRFTIRAAAGASVTIDGAGAYRLFFQDGKSAAAISSVVYEDLVFENGYSSSNGYAGGITLTQASATFNRCTFRNNVTEASSSGGGAVLAYLSTVHFNDCLFEDNSAKTEGGAMVVQGDSEVWIHDSVFFDNHTNVPNHRWSAAGGGVHVVDSQVWVTNTRFEGNEAGYVGGGLYALGTWSEPYSDPSADVVVANCTFIDNRAEPDPSVTLTNPSEAGAVHAENQARIRIYHSRFLTNSAHVGGGVNLYRAVVEIDDSVFRGNYSSGTSLGGWAGAISAHSGDNWGESINYPSANLKVTDTVIQGRYGGIDIVAKSMGALYVAGDWRRQYGDGGFPQMGTLADNRATAYLENVIVYDCDVTNGGAVAGGINAELADITIKDSLIAECDALGAGSYGGGMRLVLESVGSISGTTFAGNSAVQYGGALYVQGADIQVTDSRFIRNEISPGVSEPEGESFGAAMFSAPERYWPAPMDVTGTVSNSVFSENIGMPIFDDDWGTSPIDDIRYNGNTFHNTTFDDRVYRITASGSKTVSELNDLIVERTGAPSTDKSQVDNSWSGTALIVGAIVAAPSEIVDVVAAGDSASSTEAFVGYAWTGASATLDGSSVSGYSGLDLVDVGNHTLSVGGDDFVATVYDGAEPQGDLSADPVDISSGESSTLSWLITGGALLNSSVDRDVTLDGGPSGSAAVSPTETATYTLFVVAEEGGAVDSAIVRVDEAPPENIFADGFESGDTSAWSVE